MDDYNYELGEVIERFLSDYHKEDITKLAQVYPKDRTALYVEAKDLYRFDQSLLDDWLEQPELLKAHFEETLDLVDIPLDVDLSGAKVHLTDSNGYIDRRGVGELNESHLGKYIAIRCQLGKVSERKPRLKTGVFECNRCGTKMNIPQEFTDTQEPHECQGCERQGPFKLLSGESEWIDQRKLRLEAPPEAKSGAEITAYCLDDLADPPEVEIQDKAGSRVTVLGRLEADMSSLFGKGDNEPVADQYFVPEAFVWGNNLSNDIDIDEHREEVREAASRPDAIDVFKRNIDPGLVITEGWETALEMATAYLFAAPRIDPEVGSTVRGDIHMLFISDPGMNKSDFANKMAELSPKAVVKDSEGMSSEVALTAAATRGGFGDDSWSIEPGALPKANKGHLILDEIDKGPDGFLNGIHSPLEGDQTLKVEKAGQEANLATRCGFMALGNPTEGRFDPHQPIPEQVDLHAALMSRFDLICTMEDTPDEQIDDEIAGGILDDIDESARIDHGELDAQEADVVSGEIDRDVMKAWVKLAREEIHPMLSDKAKGILREFYVSTRQLNGEDSETPPATARTLVAGVRLAMAFARCELSETVEARHAKRAKRLSKTVVGRNFDSETGMFDADRTTETPSSQQQRVNAIRTALKRADDPLDIEAISEKANIPEDKVEHRMEKLKNKDRTPVQEVENGVFRWIA